MNARSGCERTGTVLGATEYLEHAPNTSNIKVKLFLMLYRRNEFYFPAENAER